MSASVDNADQSFSVERLDDFRCNLDGIVLDNPTPENTTGAFGDLFTGTHPTEGKLALKRPRGNLYSSNAVAAIEIEASVWKRLRYPRILQFLGIHITDDSVYFVSHYAENGSLPEFIQRRPQVDRKRLVIEICEGLVYLHQCAIVHGDLKGNNVLISKEEHVLICDFGLAKHVTSRTATSLRGVGSLPWQSPEMLQNAGKKTFESDVYAFGITVYEVLSGKEPYSQHLGLFSLINGVVLARERPPRDPLMGSDGSSYLQFWEEAERCWDGDPTRRPSMVSVLRRLDRQRFEMLVTSQQISLESSLGVDDQGHTHIQVATAQPPFNPEGDSLEPLEWGRRIQARMNGLHNLRRPIARLSVQTIGCIILEASPVASLLNSEAYINTVTSWARFRTVCKAWCRAMDNTPEFWRHIWIHRRGHNMAHIQRLRIVEPLRCLITSWDERSSSSLSRELWRDLPYRISELRSNLNIGSMNRWLQAWPPSTLNWYSGLSSLAIGIKGAPKNETTSRPYFSLTEFNNAPPTLFLEGLAFENFTPYSFRGVQVLKIVNTVVRDSFVNDLCAFICISRDIIELHLQYITAGASYENILWDMAWQSSDPFSHEGCPLSTVSLVGLHTSIITRILGFIEDCRLKVLEVDNVDSECLRDPGGWASATLNRLRCESPNEISITVTRQMTRANFRSHATSARIGFITKNAGDRKALVDSLSAFGIWRPSDRVNASNPGTTVDPWLESNYSGLPKAWNNWRTQVNSLTTSGIWGPPDGLHLIYTKPPPPHTKMIIVEIDRVEEILIPLIIASSGYNHKAYRSAWYPCPLLEELILVESDEALPPSAHNDRLFLMLCRFVTQRQQTNEEAGRIAALKRLGVPFEWIGRIERAKSTYPAFHEIEVYDTSDNASS